MAQHSRQPIFVSARNAPLGSYIQESQQSFRKLTAYYWILRESDERKVGQGEGQVDSFSETYNDPVTFQSFVLRHLLMAPVHKKKLSSSLRLSPLDFLSSLRLSLSLRVAFHARSRISGALLTLRKLREHSQL